MKILSIDIETRPNLAHVWELWNQNIGLAQLIESKEMLCFAAHYLGARGKPEYLSTFHDSQWTMIGRAWELLDDCDAVLHYNGRRFDVPHLNREFLSLGLPPPSPFKQIDLYQVVKRQFSFPSNSLAYVSKALGVGAKVKHEGHELWVKCMAGDADAWSRMRKYNINDVLLNESLYEVLLPWIPNHPSYGALTGEDVCPGCGSADLVREGHAYTQMGSYQRYRCSGCRRWSRGNKRLGSTAIAAA